MRVIALIKKQETTEGCDQKRFAVPNTVLNIPIERITNNTHLTRVRMIMDLRQHRFTYYFDIKVILRPNTKEHTILYRIF